MECTNCGIESKQEYCSTDCFLKSKNKHYEYTDNPKLERIVGVIRDSIINCDCDFIMWKRALDIIGDMIDRKEIEKEIK